MKTGSLTIAILACLGAFLNRTALSQAAPSPALLAPPAPLATPNDLLELPANSPAPFRFAQAATPAQDVLAQPPNFQQMSDVAWAAGDGNHFAVDLLSSGSRPRTLVIRSTETDQKTLSALEEDLNVMSRILSKATKEKGTDEDAVTAMGMKIRSVTVSGNASVENLYLDGYGALFLLHARFPVLPPPEPAKEEPRKESADSTWDEARRELYGPKDPAPGWKGVFTKESGRESYDATKVAKLKDSLIESLRNASNIRNLKAEEFVTIVVIGTDNSPRVRAFRRVDAGGGSKNLDVVVGEARGFGGLGGGGVGGGGLGGGGYATTGPRTATAIVRSMTGNAGETVMTLRARKADVDAFAKGNLKLEDFRKKVSTATY